MTYNVFGGTLNLAEFNSIQFQAKPVQKLLYSTAEQVHDGCSLRRKFNSQYYPQK